MDRDENAARNILKERIGYGGRANASKLYVNII
jgi:transposase